MSKANSIFKFSKETETLRKNCPYSEIFWSVYRPENTENTDQKKSKYGLFSRSEITRQSCLLPLTSTQDN